MSLKKNNNNIHVVDDINTNTNTNTNTNSVIVFNNSVIVTYDSLDNENFNKFQTQIIEMFENNLKLTCLKFFSQHSWNYQSKTEIILSLIYNVLEILCSKKIYISELAISDVCIGSDKLETDLLKKILLKYIITHIDLTNTCVDQPTVVEILLFSNLKCIYLYGNEDLDEKVVKKIASDKRILVGM
jgi:hypothetical protein